MELLTTFLWSKGLQITNCYSTKRQFEGNRNRGVGRGPLVSSLGALTLAKAFIFPFAYVIKTLLLSFMHIFYKCNVKLYLYILFILC